MFCDKIVMKLFVSYDRRFVLTFVYWYLGFIYKDSLYVICEYQQ